MQNGQTEQVQTEKHKKSILPPYGFSEATPPGDWAAIAEFDVSQTSDPDVPVVIVGLSSYSGKGQWAKQLMVDEVSLRNRSPNPVRFVRLGWIIISAEDRKAGKKRSAALREGFTEDLAATILPTRVVKLHDLQIDFVKKAKDLIRSGKLSGTAFIRLRVAEVEFIDGSIWTEGLEIAQRMHHPARRMAQSGCEDRICFFEENGQGYCTYVSEGTYCRRENCNPNDPAACYCNVYSCTDCHDQDGDGWTDCEGDCDDEPTTGRNTNPGALEYYPISNCSDGVDNECDELTEKDCLGFICRNTCTSMWSTNTLSKKTDEHGNRFRYRTKVKDTNGSKVGRWAWDVLLVVQP